MSELRHGHLMYTTFLSISCVIFFSEFQRRARCAKYFLPFQSTPPTVDHYSGGRAARFYVPSGSEREHTPCCHAALRPSRPRTADNSYYVGEIQFDEHCSATESYQSGRSQHLPFLDLTTSPALKPARNAIMPAMLTNPSQDTCSYESIYSSD